jgi:hypothetical protein
MASETLEVTTPPADAPPAEETPEEIEARLARTQEALAGKLDVLEQQTLGTIRDTIGAVTDTVNTVQNVVADPVGTVQAAVLNPIETVADGLKDGVVNMLGGFDPTDAIRQRPFESVGVAVAVGVGLGLVLFGRPKPASVSSGPPTLFQQLLSGIGAEITAMGKEVLGTVSHSVMERVKSAVTLPPTTEAPKGYSV